MKQEMTKETKEWVRRIKEQIDLKRFAREIYNINPNESGMATCPFHPGDDIPRLQFWIGKDGIYRFTDQHNDNIGTIVDLVMGMEHCSPRDAIRRLEELFVENDVDQEQDGEGYLDETIEKLLGLDLE